jgi:MFS superfamily sulfate permease-like transporter
VIDPEPAPTPVEPGRIARPDRDADQRGWMRWLPGLHTLRHYDPGWLRYDLLAGLALTAVLVPVGIAYAVASGVPAVCGLYATIFGLLAYAIFGPSRILVLGPDSSLVVLILGVVLPLSAGDPQRAMALAGMMAVVSGMLCVLAGIARLGFVTELLSKPIRYVYMKGIALAVIISQSPALLGFSIKPDSLFGEVRSIVDAVQAGKTNGVALALGLATLAVIWLLRRSTRLPGVLIAVVGTTIIVATLGLATHAGVEVVGALPMGLPAMALPLITSSDIVPVLLGGLAVALISFADTSLLSRVYAARAGDAVNTNQEMIGLGAANLAAGLFQGFPISASASRTPVAEAAGAKSQLAGVVGAVTVAALLMYAPGLLRNLPTSSLAAVVIASAISLFEISDLRRIFRIQRWEFWLSIGCLAGVVILRFRRYWAGSMASRATTTSRATPRRASCPDWCCSAGMHRCFSLMPSSFRIACWMRWRRRRCPCDGWWSARNRSPAWTSPRPTS